MIDKSRPHILEKNKTGTNLAVLTSFAPVPRQCQRHDGWTAERQRGFIEALADLGSVRAAAHAVNMTPEGAYLLRRHPAAEEFRKAWEAALKLGVQRLEDIAMERALHGVEVPVYCFGKLIGTRRVYNDALLMFILRNRSPKRFAADSWQNTDVVTKARLKRLREQWQQEWEEQSNASRAAESEEIIESIDRKLEKMRERKLAIMPPAVREKWLEYLEAKQQAHEGDEEELITYEEEEQHGIW